ncbi:MAG TPA: LytTR family DNA-binding domain-containing protein [Thermoanaerobaculia bacterium]|jgi:two-component system LytT family response regulator
MKRDQVIRAVIADDERLARQRLRRLLAEHADVQIVAECRSGYDAVRAVEEQHPDLLFLDIEIPELDGFGVIKSLSQVARMPHVVFVTAFDKYAVQAFEVRAIDYLLKPIVRERVAEAVLRAHAAIAPHGDRRDALNELLNDLSARRPSRFTIHDGGRIYFVPYASVDWIEAAGNYVRLRARAESHLMRATMHAVEESLKGTPFVRIHRSTIVNLDRIKELRPTFAGDYVVILHNDERLTLSRTYRSALDRITGGGDPDGAAPSTGRR